MQKVTEAARLRALVARVAATAKAAGVPELADLCEAGLALIPEAGEQVSGPKDGCGCADCLTGRRDGEPQQFAAPLPFSPAAAKAASDALGLRWECNGHGTWDAYNGNQRVFRVARDMDGPPVMWQEDDSGVCSVQCWIAALHGVTLLEGRNNG